jgi:hypothetical protein
MEHPTISHLRRLRPGGRGSSVIASGLTEIIHH